MGGSGQAEGNVPADGSIEERIAKLGRLAAYQRLGTTPRLRSLAGENHRVSPQNAHDIAVRRQGADAQRALQRGDRPEIPAQQGGRIPLALLPKSLPQGVCAGRADRPLATAAELVAVLGLAASNGLDRNRASCSASRWPAPCTGWERRRRPAVCWPLWPLRPRPEESGYLLSATSACEIDADLPDQAATHAAMR